MKTILAFLAALTFISCHQDTPSPQSMLLQGGNEGTAQAQQSQTGQQTQLLAKNLVECPASGYKYLNAFTLGDVSAPPKGYEGIKIKNPNEPKIIPAPEPKELASNYFVKATEPQNMLSVSISGQAFKITSGSSSIDCSTNFESSSSAISKGTTPVIAFGTKTGLSIAIITELICPPYTTYSEAGAIKFVFAATSTDFTTKLEQSNLPDGLNLDISPKTAAVAGSINASPPGTKAETAQNPAVDYIYFLSSANWVGRIKPQMAASGCVEFIDYWAPTVENPAADSLRIEDKLFVIETPAKLVKIDLTSGSRVEAAK